MKLISANSEPFSGYTSLRTGYFLQAQDFLIKIPRAINVGHDYRYMIDTLDHQYLPPSLD
jgi:hypothetical protein